jgi:uncharacterized membrane protein
MPDEAIFCPGCGREVREPERAEGNIGILPRRLAGALAYFLLPAIAFLLMEPYRDDRFVRFHAFQCIGAWIAAIVITAILRIAAVVVGMIPVVGYLFLWLFSMLVSLAFFIIWVVLVVKALQGEMFELPFVGKIAAQQAAKI